MRISTRLSLLNGLLLALTVLGTSVTILFILHGELERQAVGMQESRLKAFWALAAHKGAGSREADGRLLIGDTPVNGNEELPDQEQARTGREAAQQVEHSAAEAMRNASASTELSATAREIEAAVKGLEQIAVMLQKAVGRFKS